MRRILAIDQSVEFLRSLARYLAASGAGEVDQAVGIAAGIDAYVDNTYDAVLVEWNSGAVDVRFALQWLRAQPARPQVVVLTRDLNADAGEALAAGAEAVWSKDSLPELLVEILA